LEQPTERFYVEAQVKVTKPAAVVDGEEKAPRRSRDLLWLEPRRADRDVLRFEADRHGLSRGSGRRGGRARGESVSDRGQKRRLGEEHSSREQNECNDGSR